MGSVCSCPLNHLPARRSGVCAGDRGDVLIRTSGKVNVQYMYTAGNTYLKPMCVCICVVYVCLYTAD